jgi:hypothetical protein
MTYANETAFIKLPNRVTLGRKSLQETLTLKTLIAISYLETKMKIHHAIIQRELRFFDQIVRNNFFNNYTYVLCPM